MKNPLSITLREIINYNGEEQQARQAMEECAELIQAINKMLRYKGNEEARKNLIKEIADVEFMLYQLYEIFNIDEKEVAEVRNEAIFNTFLKIRLNRLFTANSK